ncbi:MULTISPECIES: hypothetical protein [Flavobacterium]|uniref:hypothetical protein n=1 Tax=Flavobacterium TaxID=237 RepID=UPI001FCBD2A8|nr:MULTISPECIES: hypothetical protein [Flavobacterium]UOK42091.1 hypothetical protein LZF87_12330 [Flavobacterium enshiense]
MNKSTPALLLYFAASLMYVLSIAFQWDDTFALLFKPMIFPAIYFYYWQESKSKPQLMSSLILLLFFVGDMIILVDSKNLLIPLILSNLFAYSILTFSVTGDLLKIKNPEISNLKILTVFTVITILVSLLYFAMSLVFNASGSNFSLMMVYGIVLMLLSITILIYYVLKSDTASFFVLMTIICFIISDLFHILYNYYEHFQVFININVCCQVISFYFLVKYFLHQSSYTSQLNYEEDDE